jgi:hypothetical protein
VWEVTATRGDHPFNKIPHGLWKYPTVVLGKGWTGDLIHVGPPSPSRPMTSRRHTKTHISLIPQHYARIDLLSRLKGITHPQFGRPRPICLSSTPHTQSRLHSTGVRLGPQLQSHLSKLSLSAGFYGEGIVSHFATF